MAVIVMHPLHLLTDPFCRIVNDDFHKGVVLYVSKAFRKTPKEARRTWLTVYQHVPDPLLPYDRILLSRTSGSRIIHKS